jgi:hypothetical protein
MNRCTALFPEPPLRRRLLATALIAPLLGYAGLASAQLVGRPFPVTAERGVMAVTVPPEVRLNGKPDRLAPGARIRGMNNLLVLSGSVIGQNLLVNYVRNPTGELQDIWILTPDEAALKLPTQK